MRKIIIALVIVMLGLVMFSLKNFQWQQPEVTPLPENSSLSIAWSKSFGMCGGYCFSTIRVDQAKTSISRTSLRNEKNYPPIYKEYPTNQNFWKKLTTLIDAEKIEKIANRIGCPDCADGGAETVTVIINGVAKNIEYEYGFPPLDISEIAKEMKTEFELFSE